MHVSASPCGCVHPFADPALHLLVALFAIASLCHARSRRCLATRMTWSLTCQASCMERLVAVGARAPLRGAVRSQQQSSSRHSTMRRSVWFHVLSRTWQSRTSRRVSVLARSALAEVARCSAQLGKHSACPKLCQAWRWSRFSSRKAQRVAPVFARHRFAPPGSLKSHRTSSRATRVWNCL